MRLPYVTVAGAPIATIATCADAAEVVEPGGAERMRGVSIPPLAELLAGAQKRGIPFNVWRGRAIALQT